MDAELKAKWLEALRSGKYDQGTGQLRNGNCFCCLGVLCDVFNPTGWDGEEWSFGEGIDQCRELSVLPSNFRLQCGMDGGLEERLIELNDEGKTFSTIANYIEENL